MITYFCHKNEILYKQGLNEIAGLFISFREIDYPLSKCYTFMENFFQKYCMNFYVDEVSSSPI